MTEKDISQQLSSEKPLLIFGGPYSNLQATQALQQQASKLGIPASHCICTGDTVAYFASPTETVTLLRDWGVTVLMGNCEESLASNADECGCGFANGSQCLFISSLRAFQLFYLLLVFIDTCYDLFLILRN